MKKLTRIHEKNDAPDIGTAERKDHEAWCRMKPDNKGD